METVKAIVVGCGSISGAWLRACEQFDDVVIAGMCDLDLAATRKKASEFSLDVPTGTDVRAMIEQTGATVVFDCTVPGAHPAVDSLAMELGCDVMTEKPLAESLTDAAEVVQMAKDRGRLHAVMQNRRYLKDGERFRRLLAAQEIGPVTTLYADFFVGAHFEGFRQSMPHVLLLDMAIHTFDAARYFLNTRPSRVVCHEWNPPGSWYETGASAVATFEMENGVVFNYRGSWCAEGAGTSWESEWRAIGTRGTALWDGAEGVSADVPHGDEFIRAAKTIAAPELDPLPFSGHAGCIREFLDAVHRRNAGDPTAEPQTVSHDNIYSLAMSLGSVESAETGKWVETWQTA